jgi:quinol monooxygenase YgiN
MFVHIWRMRARKKRVTDYEKFARQVTLPSLKKIDGCLGAHFVKILEARKPEYLWLVFWKDHKALEQARTNPIWRDQSKKFEAGKFHKSIPIELVCESFDSFGVPAEKPKRAVRTARVVRPRKVRDAAQPEAAKSGATESPGTALPGPTPEGE